MVETVVYSLSEEGFKRADFEYLKAMTDMRETKLLYDAVLQADDKSNFPVHKINMSLCSAYFRALFTTSIGLNNSCGFKVFCIPGVEGRVMEKIIEYAYTGKIELTEDNVTELLIGADQFNVLGMLKDCCDFLSERLDCENCIGIREFARTFFCFELEREANRCLMRDFLEVTETSEEYFQWPIEQVVLLLNSEDINVRTEELVWEAGLRWIDYRPHERKKFMPSIMRCVRLGLLDTTYFMERVRQHPYVESNDRCRPIVIDTLRFLWDLESINEMTEEIDTPFLATPRIPYSILFTIGGWNSGHPTNMIEAYDTKADRWIKVPETDPDGARAYHKLSVIGFNIYAIGGFNGNEYFNSCRCFNAVSKTWRDIAPMHCKRCYVSVATLDGQIYAMGGYDGRHRQNTVERYNLSTNQWTFLAPMNVQRSDASATTLNGFIYIVGGFNGTECLSSSEFYNPATNQWTSITSMGQRRSGVSVINYHGHIYAMGGFNGISRLSTGEKYDPVADRWSAVPEMFNPRSNFAIEILDDMIFAIGGFNGVTTIFHVECYSDRTKEWYEATDMNAFRSALAACVVHGLINVRDYVHQNRRGLMEEKRQKILQQRVTDAENRNSTVAGPLVPRQPVARRFQEENDDEEEF